MTLTFLKSFKVKSDGLVGFPIYDFQVVLNTSIYGLTLILMQIHSLMPMHVISRLDNTHCFSDCHKPSCKNCNVCKCLPSQLLVTRSGVGGWGPNHHSINTSTTTLVASEIQDLISDPSFLSCPWSGSPLVIFLPRIILREP